MALGVAGRQYAQQVVAQGIAALVAVVAIVGVGAGVDAIGLAIVEVDTFNPLRLRLFARISLLRHLLRHHHHLFAIARLIASPFVFLLFASLSVVQ